MKTITILLISTLLFCVALSVSAQDQPKDMFVYDHSSTYDGPFKSSALYKRGENKIIWFASGQLKSIREVSCTTARSSLQANGTWVGNLSLEGECLDPGEAPEWTTGNYLNYLSEKNRRQFNRTSTSQTPSGEFSE